jgi:valyl-tRNA synthetase
MKKLQEEGQEVFDKKELFRGCMEFCLERKKYMQGQEKKLGISADFDRDIFTLDSQVSNLVQDTFIRMYKA